MKLTLKIICIILASIIAITLGFFIYYLITTRDAVLNENNLINMEEIINFYDNKGNLLKKESKKRQVTEISQIPTHVQNAFIAIEDRRFYSHNGVDYKGLARAMLTNVKSFSFKEGGSTISQQLIKNTHLSNQKTIKRKLTEIKLARELEKNYSKEQILEKYLNTIYFGNNCYGITSATETYFDKKVEDLTVNEGAILAAIIKAPSNYSPLTNIEKCAQRKNLVLTQMYKEGYIDKECLENNLKESIEISGKEIQPDTYDFNYLARKELNEIIKDFPYTINNLNVYTTIDSNIQNIIENKLINIEDNANKTSILLNKNGEICAYYSSCGDIPRQIGSTIKPLLVYAPAIENDITYSVSPILDEKIDIGGYTPSNYNDKYYGYISVKESLSKSLNSCAVKLLNYTSVEKAKSYLKKMNFPFSENDNSLCLALGATENGVKITKLASLYSVFLNEGEFISPYIIKKIECDRDGVIYKHKTENVKIFSEETTHILNDMLESTVKEGTAKKLSFINIPLCAKTGTVGNENGNTDAYCISYNSERILATWLGNKDADLMDNSITGGNKPTIISSEIWNKIYSNSTPPRSYKKSNLVDEYSIDLIEYKNCNNVLLASDLTPSRYTKKALFKKSKLPNISDKFLQPKINDAKLNVLSNGNVEILLDIPEYYQAYIYRANENQKVLIYDTFEKEKGVFIDKSIALNTEYSYSIIPYYLNDKQIIKGNEIILNRIKTPNTTVNDWWADEFE